MPLFAFGQIGVKVYVLPDPRHGNLANADPLQLAASVEHKDTDTLKTKGTEDREENGTDGCPSSSDPVADGEDSATADVHANGDAEAVESMPDTAKHGTTESCNGEDDKVVEPVVCNSWTPPETVDWTAVSHALTAPFPSDSDLSQSRNAQLREHLQNLSHLKEKGAVHGMALSSRTGSGYLGASGRRKGRGKRKGSGVSFRAMMKTVLATAIPLILFSLFIAALWVAVPLLLHTGKKLSAGYHKVAAPHEISHQVTEQVTKHLNKAHANGYYVAMIWRLCRVHFVYPLKQAAFNALFHVARSSQWYFPNLWHQ
mmetsp:Transcript_2398/g.5600  ORF Transcript_2398/g.5600 Transcript_2398/m.5600 type:complete len:314 (-) Transcript_2398:260-1201(-)